MRIYSVQPHDVIEALKKEKILLADPRKSRLLRDEENDEYKVFEPAYQWIIEQMNKHGIERPVNGITPWWGWSVMDWIKGVDINELKGYHEKGERFFVITLEVPDKDVLQSDEEAWHTILNNLPIIDASSDEEFDKYFEWYDSQSEEMQKKVKLESWNKVFDINPYESDWDVRGRYVQAVFWELREDRVIEIREFIGTGRSHY